jgi:hypothetical protein
MGSTDPCTSLLLLPNHEVNGKFQFQWLSSVLTSNPSAWNFVPQTITILISHASLQHTSTSTWSDRRTSGWNGVCQRDDVATAPGQEELIPRAKLRHSTDSTVSCGSHTLTDYILYTLLDGFPLGKDHTVNVDGTATNDDILGAE